MKRTLPTSWRNTTDTSSDSMDIDNSTDENILSEDSPSEETDSIVDSVVDSEDSFGTDSEDSFFDAFATETEDDTSDDDEDAKIEILRQFRKAAEDSETDFFKRMSRLRIVKRPSDDTDEETESETLSSFKKMRLR